MPPDSGPPVGADPNLPPVRPTPRLSPVSCRAARVPRPPRRSPGARPPARAREMEREGGTKAGRSIAFLRFGGGRVQPTLGGGGAGIHRLGTCAGPWTWPFPIS